MGKTNVEEETGSVITGEVIVPDSEQLNVVVSGTEAGNVVTLGNCVVIVTMISGVVVDAFDVIVGPQSKIVVWIVIVVVSVTLACTPEDTVEVVIFEGITEIVVKLDGVAVVVTLEEIAVVVTLEENAVVVTLEENAVVVALEEIAVVVSMTEGDTVTLVNELEG